MTSVFDLSPAEKLQLVEDLWDDLAATPEAVPCARLAKTGIGPAKGESADESGLGTRVGRSQAQGPQPVWPLN